MPTCNPSLMVEYQRGLTVGGCNPALSALRRAKLPSGAWFAGGVVAVLCPQARRSEYQETTSQGCEAIVSVVDQPLGVNGTGTVWGRAIVTFGGRLPRYRGVHQGAALVGGVVGGVILPLDGRRVHYANTGRDSIQSGGRSLAGFTSWRVRIGPEDNVTALEPLVNCGSRPALPRPASWLLFKPISAIASALVSPSQRTSGPAGSGSSGA